MFVTSAEMLLRADTKQGVKVTQTEAHSMNHKGEGYVLQKIGAVCSHSVHTLNVNSSSRLLGHVLRSLERSAFFLLKAFQRLISGFYLEVGGVQVFEKCLGKPIRYKYRPFHLD